MVRTLLFYTHAFSGGGAEMVFARLARAFADGGDRVVFAADHPGPLPIEDRGGLRHVLLGGGHGRGDARTRRDPAPRAARRLVLGPRRAEPQAPRRGNAGRAPHGAACSGCTASPPPSRSALAQLSYRLSPATTRLSARTICVSDALLSDMVTTWGARGERMVRIHNPLPADAGAGGWTPEVPPLVLAIGRLDPVKRFPISSRPSPAQRRRDARLAILGEGPERGRIADTIARLGLGGSAALPGHVADPAPWYRRAACLAVSSASESFGLTVAERFAHMACRWWRPIAADRRRCSAASAVWCRLATSPRWATALAAALADPGDPVPRRARAAVFALEHVRDAYAGLADALG